MSFITQDPDNGLYIRGIKLSADDTAALSQKLIDLDTQLDTQLNDPIEGWYAKKGAATSAANTAQEKIDAAVLAGDAEDEAAWRAELALQNGKIATADSNIARDTMYRNHAAEINGYISELIVARAGL